MYSKSGAEIDDEWLNCSFDSDAIKILNYDEPWGQRTIRIFDPHNHLIEIGGIDETVCDQVL